MKHNFCSSLRRTFVTHLLCFSVILNSVYAYGSYYNVHGYSTSNLPNAIQDDQNDNIVQYLEVDTWNLIPQEVIEHPKAGMFRAENVVLSLLEADRRYNQREVILPRPFIDAPTDTNIRFTAPVFSKDDKVQIELKYQDKAFWHFQKPIRTAARYGNYIVFIESEDIYLDENKAVLSFIDLSYFRSTLGSSEGYLPIFQVDVPITNPDVKISIQDRSLFVNDFPIPRYILDELGLVLSTTWNIQANLLTYETYFEQEQLLESFLDDLNSVESARFDSLLSKVENESQIESVKNRLRLAVSAAQNTRNMNEADILQKSEQIAREFVIESDESKRRIENFTKMYAGGRKLANKAKVIMERLKIPRPMAGGTIREALGFVIGGLTGPRGQRAWQVKEGALRILYNKKAIYGAPLASAILLGHFNPGVFQDFVYQVIDFGGTISETVNRNFNKLFSIVKQSFLANGIIRPQNLKVYFEDSVIDRFIIANLNIIKILFLSFTIPHVVINAFYLRKDMIQDVQLQQDPVLQEYNNLKQSGKSSIVAILEAVYKNGSLGLRTLAFNLKESFIRRQDREYKQYLFAQTEDYLDSTEAVEFSNEEDAKIREILAQVSERKKGHIGTFLSKMKNRMSPLKDKIPTSESIKALRNFLFSWNSLQKTYRVFTIVWWKYIFQSRSFIPWKPITAATLFYYPKSFDISTMNGIDSHTVHRITSLNGGRRPFWRQYPLSLGSLISKKVSVKYNAYKEWEKHILTIETRVLEKAQNMALEMTAQNLDMRTIRNLSEYSKQHEMLNQLNKEQTQFYQTTFDYLFNSAMHKIIQPITDEIMNIEGPTCELSVSDCIKRIDKYKPQTLDIVLQLSPTDEEIDNVFDEIISDSHFNRRQVENILDTNNERSSVIQFVNNKLYESMNPHKNRQVHRWVMTEKQLNDSGAMTRATRKTFYKFLQRVPEFLIIWLLAAGNMSRAVSGELTSNDMSVPLTDEFPYWSPYLIGMVFLADTIQTMLSDFGFMLQEEYKHNKAGFFNKAPPPPKKNISFLRLYWQKIWEKDNKFWPNTKHYLGLVWSDIPSYTTMYILISIIFLKRLDLDPYTLTYIMYILFPTKGVVMKLDQGLEGAMSGYWYKDIPEEHLRKHPLVQQYISNKKNKVRLIYQAGYFFIHTLFITGTLTNIKIIGIDTSRELARLIMGFPPTVWAVKILESIKQTTGLDRLITICQKALSNKYDGWNPLSDGKMPDWLKEPWKKNPNRQ